MMILTLLDGIKWGLFLSVLAGPILLSLVEAGLEGGLKLGAILGSGVWLSDILFAVLMYLGVSSVSLSPDFYLYVGWGGGIVLMCFGISSFFIKMQNSEEKIIRSSTYGGYFLKGFLINTLNPFSIFFWFTISTTEATKYGNVSRVTAFYLGILGTIMATDMMKVLLAKYIKQWMTPAHMAKVKKIGGLLMIIFGIALIVRVVLNPPV